MNRLCLLVVCGLLGASPDALAQPSAAAKPHVEAGVKAYNAADYETAIREFELAYGIDEDSVLLYAWAQAQRQAGHCDKAIGLYRRYIESKPTDVQIEAANTGISLCDQMPAVPPKPEKLPPPPPDPVIQPPPSDSPPWYKDQLGGGLVIGGVASLAIGATFLVLSSSSEDAANQGTRAEFLDHLDEATLRRRIGIVGLGIGLGLATAGIVRYSTRDVVVTASGTSVVVSGRF